MPHIFEANKYINKQHKKALADDYGYSDSTVCTTLIDKKGNIITANLGDSSAFALIYDIHGQCRAVTRLNERVKHTI